MADLKHLIEEDPEISDLVMKLVERINRIKERDMEKDWLRHRSEERARIKDYEKRDLDAQ